VDVQAYLAEHAALVDAFLEGVLPQAGPPPGPPCSALHAAMRHLVFPGGKRLRPAFAFAGCEAAGGAPQRALPLAAAVELVHVYSLIHDDLPCMDDDRERRGRPTVHVAFGEAEAVLAGDALLARAFEVLAAAAPPPEPHVVLAALRELAAACGSEALVGGQADDLALSAAAAVPDARQVEDVHRRKSAALIAAAVAGGARFGGADEALAARLRRFGELAGVAFQIADDLLDRDGDGACSAVRALGEHGARRRAETLLEDALAEIEALGERAEPLRELARFAARRER
jgi:geranylgeranyl diphosphate synthase type II